MDIDAKLLKILFNKLNASACKKKVWLHEIPGCETEL